MSAPWAWWAFGLALTAILLYAANVYMDAVIRAATEPDPQMDIALREDWQWAGIEEEWHQFLDSFPMTAERS